MWNRIVQCERAGKKLNEIPLLICGNLHVKYRLMKDEKRTLMPSLNPLYSSTVVLL